MATDETQPGLDSHAISDNLETETVSQPDSLDKSSSPTTTNQTPNAQTVSQTQGPSYDLPSQDTNISTQHDGTTTKSQLEHHSNPGELSRPSIVGHEPNEENADQMESNEGDKGSQDDRATTQNTELPLDTLPGPTEDLAKEPSDAEVASHSGDGASSQEQDDSSEHQTDDSSSAAENISRHSINSYKPEALIESVCDSELFYASIGAAAESSGAAKEWLNLLRDMPEKENTTLDEIMRIFGHEEVKSHCLSAFRPIQNEVDEKGACPSFPANAIFCGNEGLGAKRLSELYAKLLETLSCGEFSKEELHATADVERILKSTHDQTSIILIDDLISSADCLASLNKLFYESSKVHPSVYIIACTTWSSSNEKIPVEAITKMEQPLNKFLLQDYTLEQLWQMLALAARHSQVEFEDGPNGTHLQEAVELISHGRGKPGFRNWIAVRESLKAMMGTKPEPNLMGSMQQPNLMGNVQQRNLMANMQQRRNLMMNMQQGNLMGNKQRPDGRQKKPILLTKADILGETAVNLERRSLAWKKLNAMVGLHEVKNLIRLYFSENQYRHCRVLQGRQPPMPLLNRLFLGPPGTGKTTTARLLAEILSDVGLVSNNVVIEYPTTLIDKYVGHSEQNVRDAVTKARGGILIIDDAHAFFSGGTNNSRESPDSFRSGIIDTLVSQYQQYGKDATRRLTVFFVGHKEPIVELLATSNVGLGQMLRLDEALHFPTYSDEHLRVMLRQGIDAADLEASPEAMTTAHELLSLAKHRPNFGNAMAVESLLNTATSRHQARVLATMDIHKALAEPLHPQDFDPDWARRLLASQQFSDLFSKLHGMEHIANRFQGYQELVVRLRKMDLDPRPYVPMSFVFKGPPGTGKTTVARKVAQIYYNMGFLSAPEMIECSVTQLVSTHRGKRTGVEVMFERALGKVLFIDEAYLLQHTGGHGAIGDLVDCMTKERFAGKLIVVMAGYTEDMDELLEENRGLRSRFATEVMFAPMKPTDAISLLKQLLEDVNLRITGLELGDPLRQQAVRFLARLAATKSWANGRDVEAVARVLIQNTFKGLMAQQQNDTSADVAATQSSVMEVSAIAVIRLLASHLGKNMEVDEKTKAAAKEQEQDRRARTGPNRRQQGF